MLCSFNKSHSDGSLLQEDRAWLGREDFLGYDEQGSERNLETAALSQQLGHLIKQTARYLKWWREKFSKAKRGENRVCCNSESHWIGWKQAWEQRPTLQGHSLQGRKLFTSSFVFWFSLDRPIWMSWLTEVPLHSVWSLLNKIFKQNTKSGKVLCIRCWW